jgi:hypothetical protein
MIFRVDDQVGNGARRQSFQPYPTSTTPPCGGVGWASSPSVPLGTTWLRRDACRLGVTSGGAGTGARRIGKGAAAMVVAVGKVAIQDKKTATHVGGGVAAREALD